jgi:transcription antitermination factor NusG
MKALKPQPFLDPPDLFCDTPAAQRRYWTCAYTRARFEKRLCNWLHARNTAYYLPTIHQRKACGRTRYEVDAPLFAGYVFVLGDFNKGDLKDSGCVTEVLKPSTLYAERLERDIWTVWRGLVTGSHLELVKKLQRGDIVELQSPPYAGMQGRFERWGRHGRLHVWLDIMGCGALIELSESDVTLPLARRLYRAS